MIWYNGCPNASKFMFSKKAKKIDEIFTGLTLCNKRQINGEDFFNFRGLLRKYELYSGKKLLKYDALRNQKISSWRLGRKSRKKVWKLAEIRKTGPT